MRIIGKPLLRTISDDFLQLLRTAFDTKVQWKCSLSVFTSPDFWYRWSNNIGMSYNSLGNDKADELDTCCDYAGDGDGGDKKGWSWPDNLLCPAGINNEVNHPRNNRKHIWKNLSVKKYICKKFSWPSIKHWPSAFCHRHHKTRYNHTINTTPAFQDTKGQWVRSNAQYTEWRRPIPPPPEPPRNCGHPTRNGLQPGHFIRSLVTLAARVLHHFDWNAFLKSRSFSKSDQWFCSIFIIN